VPRVVRIEREDGAAVCERCVVADRMGPRMRGLLGRDALPPGEGILLRPASSVHTAFMRFPIDVVFVDRGLVVKKVVAALPPWRAAVRPGARATLELAAGEAGRRGIEVGSQLVLVE
jgi:hypothetical protein